MKCYYLRETADGVRCILQPPEVFVYVPGCYKGGSGCPVYEAYMKVRASGRFAGQPASVSKDDRPKEFTLDRFF